jgi:hypothetical protein
VQELAHSWLNIGATAISSRLRALTLMLRERTSHVSSKRVFRARWVLDSHFVQ